MQAPIRPQLRRRGLAGPPPCKSGGVLLLESAALGRFGGSGFRLLLAELVIEFLVLKLDVGDQVLGLEILDAVVEGELVLTLLACDASLV